MPHLYYSWNLYYEFIIPYYYFISFTQLRDPLQIFICNRCLFSTFLVNFLMTHFWKRVLIPTCCESVKWESFSVDWLQRQWWNGKQRCVRCDFLFFFIFFFWNGIFFASTSSHKTSWYIYIFTQPAT